MATRCKVAGRADHHASGWEAGVLTSIGFDKVLLNCWEHGCLPIVIGEEPPRPTPPGVLWVAVASDRMLEGSKIAAPQDDSHHRVSLRLPESCLTGVFDSRDGIDQAAVTYLTLAAAALPAPRSPAILERASLLGLVSPILGDGGANPGYFRLIDLNAAFGQKDRIQFPYAGGIVAWDERSGDKESVFDIARCFRDAGEVELRGITLVRPDALMRHLAALEQLARVRTISLTRILQASGIAVFRANHQLRFELVDLTFKMMRTLASESNARLPFVTVARDMPIQINAAAARP